MGNTTGQVIGEQWNTCNLNGNEDFSYSRYSLFAQAIALCHHAWLSLLFHNLSTNWQRGWVSFSFVSLIKGGAGRKKNSCINIQHNFLPNTSQWPMIKRAPDCLWWLIGGKTKKYNAITCYMGLGYILSACSSYKCLIFTAQIPEYLQSIDPAKIS